MASADLEGDDDDDRTHRETRVREEIKIKKKERIRSSRDREIGEANEFSRYEKNGEKEKGFHDRAAHWRFRRFVSSLDLARESLCWNGDGALARSPGTVVSQGLLRPPIDAVTCTSAVDISGRECAEKKNGIVRLQVVLSTVKYSFMSNIHK